MRRVLSEIQPIATRRTFKKRSILLYQGEAPRMAYAMVSGIIKVYSINSAGEEQIATFHTAGDIFPSPWIFSKATTTLYYYETLSDCVILTLPREALHTIIKQNPELMAWMLDYFVTNYTGSQLRVTALEQARAREKIMFTLYYLLFRYGQLKRPGKYSINLELTHSILASLVGLTRETTTTELGKLKREHIVSYTTHSYVVDKGRLERALGEDSFKDVFIR